MSKRELSPDPAAPDAAEPAEAAAPADEADAALAEETGDLHIEWAGFI